MQWLVTRLAALGTALIITGVLLAAAGLASKYMSEHTKAPPKPPQEYLINLQPSPKGKVP